jgi:hypothetical protein
MTSGNGKEAHDGTYAGALREHRSGLQIEFAMGYSRLMSKANIKRTAKTPGELRDLISIGPAMARDFKLLASIPSRLWHGKTLKAFTKNFAA